MFNELHKYKQQQCFIFRKDDDLERLCKAPTDKAGLYIVDML